MHAIIGMVIAFVAFELGAISERNRITRQMLREARERGRLN